jgi:peptide/nickel transport system permease protein
MLSLVPGNPAAFVAGQGATHQQIAAINREYHFQDPIFVRYWDWLKEAASGHLGTSYLTNQSVASAIGSRLPVTLELSILATALALVIAIPSAMACARRPRSRFARGVGILSPGAVSFPAFVLAIILVYLFAYKLKIFPVLGWVPPTQNLFENLRGAALPVISIAVAESVVLLRVLRASLVLTLQQDFIALARARGLSPRAIMWKHALRPSSLPLMTLSALTFARFLGGTVIVESIFVLPGIGALMLQSVTDKDLAMVQGIVAFVAVVFLVVNFIVDILYGVLDPRSRVQAHD